ncbi:MAG: PHP domain-containing protein [Anaerolineaceae bacterium]|nr:PHP domain-containing protein [Anaerolineaceae bacterium]
MVKVEFHCHTIYSKDSLMQPAALVETCRQKGIDRVIITDHNEIIGAQLAQQIDPHLVIVGEEIMTTCGEVLAAFVSERIPPHLTPEDTISRLRDQGAFIGVSHPFDHRRKGAWQLADLLTIAPYVDAIETYNARCLEESPNRLSQAFAAQYGLPGTVGSDAHIAWELGRATLRLPDFDCPEDLCLALEQAQVSGSLSPGWVHFMSFGARMWKKARGITPGHHK